MDRIAYEFTRKRSDFGRHPNFQDSEVVDATFPPPKAPTPPGEDAEVESTEGVDEEPKEPEEKWVPRTMTIREIGCIPEVSEHYVNTESFEQDDKGMGHMEGGWPKTVNTGDFSEKQRHIRKIETDEFDLEVEEITQRAERIVKQNNAMNVFESYFGDVDLDHTGDPPSAKTVTIFRDPSKNMPRGVSKISWHPDSVNKIAVSYCTLQFQHMPDNIPLESYIWDIYNPNRPDFTIKPQSPLVTSVFNPRSYDHLAGGCYNGVIGFWDLRKGSTPVSKTLIEQSHNDPVYDIYWIQSRTGQEFSSVSTDGMILWWDARKLGSGPMDSMQLQPEEGGKIYGGTALEYRGDAGATRFLVGTEQGTMMTIERKAKKGQESQKAFKCLYGVDSGCHHGPVYTVERNAIFPKVMLTVGDWAANIWMEDTKTPIMSTPYDPSYLTCGTWSPVRPGVFFTAKKDGVVDVWDFFYKQTEPIVALKIGEHPLTSITTQSQGKLVAVGNQNGSTTILELCSSLVESSQQEKPAILSMFEREMNREKNLQARLLAQRRAQELAEKRGDAGKKKEVKVEVPEPTKDEMSEVDSKFWALVEKNKPDPEKYKGGQLEAGASDPFADAMAQKPAEPVAEPVKQPAPAVEKEEPKKPVEEPKKPAEEEPEPAAAPADEKPQPAAAEEPEAGAVEETA